MDSIAALLQHHKRIAHFLREPHNRSFIRNVSEQLTVCSLRTFGSRNSTYGMHRNSPDSIFGTFASFLRFRYFDFPYARLAPRWHLGAALGAAISNSPGAKKKSRAYYKLLPILHALYTWNLRSFFSSQFLYRLA